MPVALNEPLSLLQRLSEELEYPELLDIANHTDDPFERMVKFVCLRSNYLGIEMDETVCNLLLMIDKKYECL